MPSLLINGFNFEEICVSHSYMVHYLYGTRCHLTPMKRYHGSVREIQLQIASMQMSHIDTLVDVYSDVRGIVFDLCLHLYSHFLYASSKGSCEFACMCRHVSPSLLTDTISAVISSSFTAHVLLHV